VVFDKELIGQQDDAAQEDVVDQEDEKDIAKIIFKVDEFREGDLCRGEGHDQDEGGQDETFQRKSIVAQKEAKEKGNEKDEVAVP
jgi:hypothetical protein